jgi:tRNA G18 (ribose-2'-O)-methylase SpoU
MITKSHPFPWTRNVLDKYKLLSNEEIKIDLKNNSLPFAVMMQHIEGDFNIGSVIRTANSLGAREIFYFGKKKYDKRAACGVYNYSDVKYLVSIEEIISLKEKYFFVGLENNIKNKTHNINNYKWRENSLIVIGEEGSGLTQPVIDLCDDFVEIPGRGSVRSLNAGVASGIAMNLASAQLASDRL